MSPECRKYNMNNTLKQPKEYTSYWTEAATMGMHQDDAPNYRPLGSFSHTTCILLCTLHTSGKASEPHPGSPWTRAAELAPACGRPRAPRAHPCSWCGVRVPSRARPVHGQNWCMLNGCETNLQRPFKCRVSRSLHNNYSK